MVCTGATEAIAATLLGVLDPGDEVILFEPFYSYHRSSLLLMGAKPVCVPLVGADFALDLTALKKAISPHTRGIIINTPGNPSGKGFSQEELQAIAELLDGSDIIVFTDEVYEYMCFDGRRHISPATVPGLEDRTLTIGGFSKTYSVTGWRIGYMAGPTDVVDRIGRVFDQIDVCAARPMQRGVQRALEQLPPSFYSDLQADYQRKRDQFCAALVEGGWQVCVPQGAYYVMADYRGVYGDLDPESAVMKMIAEKGVNGVPGHLFFEDPEPVRQIRFHFAVPNAVLDDACERLAKKSPSSPE